MTDGTPSFLSLRQNYRANRDALQAAEPGLTWKKFKSSFADSPADPAPATGPPTPMTGPRIEWQRNGRKDRSPSPEPPLRQYWRSKKETLQAADPDLKWKEFGSVRYQLGLKTPIE